MPTVASIASPFFFLNDPATTEIYTLSLHDALPIFVLGAVTVVDEDGDRARRIARREVAPYFDVVGELDPTVSLKPELVARVRERVRAHDHEGAGALIPDDLLDRFAFSGTPEEVARHAKAVLDAGARRVDFGAPRGFELLCKQVLPRL